MIKPLREMTDEELREAINDPIGPDYENYQREARLILSQRIQDRLDNVKIKL